MKKFIFKHKVLLTTLCATIALLVMPLIGCASYERCSTDCASEMGNGLDRIINVYTFNGTKIATYEGKIDVEHMNNVNYVLFHVNGKRYVYYFATVEIIEK